MRLRPPREPLDEIVRVLAEVEARFGREAVHSVGLSESIEFVGRQIPVKFSVGRRFSKYKDNSPKKSGERFLNMLGADAGKLPT